MAFTSCGIDLTTLIQLQSSVVLFFKETSARQKACIDNTSLSSLSLSGSTNNLIRNLTPLERETLERIRAIGSPTRYDKCIENCEKNTPRELCEQMCTNVSNQR